MSDGYLEDKEPSIPYLQLVKGAFDPDLLRDVDCRPRAVLLLGQPRVCGLRLHPERDLPAHLDRVQRPAQGHAQKRGGGKPSWI